MSTADRAERVAEIVEEALELDPAEHRAFLDRTCDGDAAVRAEVESLLGFRAQAETFIEQPAIETSADLLGDAGGELVAGETIGPYRVVSLLGEGGMGEVYLAHDSSLGRQVAIKLVKRGFGRANLLRHFHHEERILAALTHPNIARLYGAGETGNGVPYFVMEHIAGERLDRYCEERQLGLNERLQLFRKICSAVAYAHQHLIIHRDLKPANIRVTPEGEPKLLDFGIAKLLEPDNAEAPGQTVTLAGAMTPEYASPEQIRGETMTTASDIYSLGVVLYELLTGRKPYRLTSHSADEVSRAITTQAPVRPSQAVAERAKQIRPVSPSAIPNPKALRGDLDNIVMMALRKEPERRYASVTLLSEDIRRHLEGRPVTARKDTWNYRAVKFVSRNKIAVSAAILVLLSLIGGIIATTWQAARATEHARIAAEQRDQAQRQAVKAQRATDFLQDILGFSDPGWNSPNPNRNREATISQALTEAGRRAESELADEPEVLAAVRHTIGSTYRTQSRYAEAEPHLRAALDIRRRILGPEHPDTAQSMIAVGEWSVLTGHYAEAERLLREAAAVYRARRDEKWLAIALNDLGTLKWLTGEYAMAEQLLREALDVSANFVGPERAPRAVMFSTLGLTRRDQGDLGKAAEFLEKAIEEHRALPGEPRAELAIALSNLASVVYLRGGDDRAESLAREAFALFGKTFGENHQYSAYPLIWLAEIHCRRGDYATAMAEIQRALEIQRRVLPAEHIDFARSRTTLGKILMQTGDLTAAEAALRAAETLVRALPKTHAVAATARGVLGECLLLQQRHSEAEPLLVESHDAFVTRLGPDDPRTRDASRRLAQLHQAQGSRERTAEAASPRPQ